MKTLASLAEQTRSDVARGLVVVNTGNGKGKTTAALGLLFRAWGHDMKVVMLQFIKSTQSDFGEHHAARHIGVEIIAGGDGFTWPGITNNMEQSKLMAEHLWKIAKEKITSEAYDMIILDELSYPLMFGWLNTDDVIEVLKQRPKNLHVVITGRGVPKALIDFADVVTEAREIKHHYHQGIKAQAGIEF